MAAINWTTSDSIASFAMLVACGSLLMQFLDRGVPYKVQDYIDKTQASGKIIDAVEQVIRDRQFAMIDVDYNVYEPFWAKQMTAEQMISDSKKAEPVVRSYGAFKGAVQSNVRFFSDPKTLAALATLDSEVDSATKCFTTIASARREFNSSQTEQYREMISTYCAGANQPSSVNALRRAEAAAQAAMDAESKAGTGLAKR